MLMFELEFEQELTVSQAVWEDEELIFTVHLEECDSPENLQWDIKKTYMDVIYFRNRWQVRKQMESPCPVRIPSAASNSPTWN